MIVLRGKKLQMAMRLVADGRLNDPEIAQVLQISPGTLEAAREQPFFDRRVAEMRARMPRAAAESGRPARSA